MRSIPETSVPCQKAGNAPVGCFLSCAISSTKINSDWNRKLPTQPDLLGMCSNLRAAVKARHGAVLESYGMEQETGEKWRGVQSTATQGSCCLAEALAWLGQPNTFFYARQTLEKPHSSCFQSQLHAKSPNSESEPLEGEGRQTQAALLHG